MIRVGGTLVWSFVVGIFVLLARHPVQAQSMLYSRALSPEKSASCKSSLGGYYLPTKQLLAVVKQSSAAAPHTLTIGPPVVVADRSYYFCLLYTGSSGADDSLYVMREQQTGLLTSVTANADSKVNAILETFVDTALVGVTGNPGITMGGTARALRNDQGDAVLAQLQFDPFDQAAVAEINRTLVTYGFCVLLNGYSLPAGVTSPQQYCNSVPDLTTGANTSRLHFEPDQTEAGILYRSERTYQVEILRKRDPKGSEPWQPFQTIQVEMPNFAPVGVVAVDRTQFVARKTTLLFKSGSLVQADVEKPSETLAVLEAPLAVTGALLKLPAEIVKVRIQAVNNQQRLIDAKAKAIEVNRAYVLDKEALEKDPQYGLLTQDAGARTGRVQTLGQAPLNATTTNPGISQPTLPVATAGTPPPPPAQNLADCINSHPPGDAACDALEKQ